MLSWNWDDLGRNEDRFTQSGLTEGCRLEIE
jgi:hypothetical protein